MSKTKAFAYVRVSGKGQVQGDGLIRQESTITEYAKNHELEITHIFREKGVTGTLVNRPALADLLVTLEDNGHDIKTVIIERIDRLARDLMIQETIISDLQTKNFKLISVHEGEDLLSDDPTRKLVRQVLGAIAEYDKQMTILKLRSARERKRLKNGKCEGRKGYNEIAPDVLKEIKRLRRKRKGQKQMSYNRIAEILNENEYTTANGKLFTGNNVSTIWHRQKRK